MTPEDRFLALGLSLPEAGTPLGSYVPWVRTGNILYISGVLPLSEGRLAYSGRLGETLDVDGGAAATRLAAVNALAVVRSALGSLDKVSRIIRLTGYIASASDFTDQPRVLNGASDLLMEIFGESGRHTRVAVGAAALPKGAAVEIDMIIEARED